MNITPKQAFKALRMFNISVDEVAEQAIAALKTQLGQRGFITLAFNGEDIAIRIVRQVDGNREEYDIQVDEFVEFIKNLDKK